MHGRDDYGNCVAPGVYFGRVEAGGKSRTLKMTLAR